ncbi:MAG: c-type cytochrome, partial [Pirellula staleyi]
MVGDAIGGRVLISQLSCVACHSSAEPTVAPKSAPILDLVGTRVRFDHLVAVAGNARGTKVGTTMPDLFHGLSDEQRTANGRAIASFLSQTGKSIDRSGDSASSKRGQDLFHSIGCVACHTPRAGDSNLTSTSVPLGDLAQKYTLDGLSKFLQNPHQVRPSGLMPTLVTSWTEARDIACYL